MNIVVIGSCEDSSILAKELNLRLKNSIVARIDLLKNMKQIVLQGLHINTTKNLGTYVGDVESFDYTLLSQDNKIKVVSAVQGIRQNLKTLENENNYASNFINNTFDALTNGIPTSTYSFVKIYSGIIEDDFLNKMLEDQNFISNTILVTLKNPTVPLFPIIISKNVKDNFKKQVFADIECDTVTDIFKTELIQTLFELTAEAELPEKSEEKIDLLAADGTPPVLEWAVIEEEEVLDRAA